MVKTEFGLGGLEAILNRPATPLHSDQGFNLNPAVGGLPV
jgi:hypothetical protein